MLKIANENSKQIKDIKLENSENKKKIDSDITGIKKELESLKASLRVKNVIFYNVIEDRDDNNRDLSGKIAGILHQVGIDNRLVDSVKRIGPKTGIRPVVVTLMSQKFKKEIFEKSYLLRKKFNITVANDLSKAEREEYNKMKEIKKELKDNNIDARIVNNKIQIENKSYDFQEARKILISVRNRNKKDDNQVENFSGNLDTKLAEKKRAASSSPGQINKLERKKEKIEINNDVIHNNNNSEEVIPEIKQ